MVIKQYSFIAYKEEKNMIEKKINNFRYNAISFLSSSSNGSKYYFLSLSFLVLSLFCAMHVLNSSYNHSFETRHGPAGRHRTRPTRGWNQVGLKKKQGKKNPV